MKTQRTATARLGVWILAGIAALAGGCSGDDGGDGEDAPLAIEDGCQALLARTQADEVSRGTCLLPYPSDFYREDVGGAPRLVIRGAAKPVRAAGGDADLHDVVAMDGFSLIPTIVATLPSSVVGDGLPGILDDPSRSATAASVTVIVDAETGALVPHYTDKIDRGLDAEHEPIVLRPFAPLTPKRRYVVALKGVQLAADAPGAPGLAPPPEGFRRLRDRALDKDPALTAHAARFDRDVFAPLERAGVARADLQLAWDFTTGSAEQPRADMLRVRDLTLAWLAESTPAITITESKPGSDRIWRTVTGTITAPLYLDQPGPAGRLFRGADGLVTANGTTTFEFTVNVPISVRDRFEPGRALAYGHGFFGGRAELEGNGAKTIAEHLGAVELGIDWWGMSKEDVGRVSTTLGDDPSHGADFAERAHQAMANWLVATAALRGPLATIPELMRPAEGPGVVTGPGGASNAGQLVYDPSFVGYFGASQGHILGGTLAALDPNLSRVVLNVGGGGFTHMMPRSANFGPFSIVLDVTFKDELMVQAYVAMFQRPLDRIDPVTYAPLVGEAPERRVLLQVGLGDAQVPNAGSWLHARALGATLTTPSPAAVFGLEEAAAPTGTSALTLFDFGIDTSGYAAPSPLGQNGVHEGVRVNAGALRQMDKFLRPGGAVVHPCDGPCDPE
ncbi:MAG: hypothetical protein KF764_23925 [Labilithrix sp.]|nr:hypothetical protein [Labilithrix sp.]